ncbi:hypothetical protein A2U01_0053365, partial [Trifolium medium]|nr:hypothetical protein [Trifolium medium]
MNVLRSGGFGNGSGAGVKTKSAASVDPVAPTVVTVMMVGRKNLFRRFPRQRRCR